MSEIKGQILGVVLVLAIFGAIGTVLVTAFTNNAKNIANKIGSQSGTTDDDTQFIEDAKNNAGKSINTNNIDLSNLELLTF